MNMKQVNGTHYLKDIQPWDCFRAWWPEHFHHYCLMNAIKYIMRDKDDKVADLQKAIHYLETAIAEIQKPLRYPSSTREEAYD